MLHRVLPALGADCHKSMALPAVFLALVSSSLALFAGAADETLVQIDIEAQPLEKALEEFATQTRRQVTADSAIIRNLRSPTVRGTYTPEDALLQLVANSGLTVVEINGIDFALREGDGSPASPPIVRIEEVIVRGENLRRSLLDTNTSINVQTEADIVRSNDKRISDVFSRAANVNVNGVGLQAFTFSIRGINSSGVGGAGNGAVASLMVDGAAFTTQQLARGFNSLFDVKQVEMLRGPQSTAQARNSLAGGVVVATNDPEFERDTQAIAAYGNYGTYELGLANTGAITDELAYRITLQRLNTDGFIENTALGIDAYNYSDTDTVRGKLLYRPKALPLEILLSHTHVQADALNDTSSWFPERRRFENGNVFGSGGMDTEQDVTTLNIAYRFNERLRFEAQTAYNEFISEDLNSNYATSLPDRDQAWFATADQEEFNQTLRLVYDGTGVRGAVGVFYSDETNIVLRDGVALLNAFGNGLDADFIVDSPLTTETVALFGEFDIDLGERITLTLGGRYEEIDLESVSRSELNLILPPPAPYTVVVPGVIDAELDASTKFSEFLPKVGVTYALSGTQRLGFTYSEGYRQGGITANILTLTVEEFDPEYVQNYELSYKASFDGGLGINANLFYLDWSDQQVLDTPPGSVISATLNAGKSEVYGAELELSYRTGNWDAYATLGYANTEFKEFSTDSGDFTGNDFPNAPELTAALGAFYTFQNWTIGAEGNYRDGFFTQANNNFKTESLLVVDLSADYRYGDVTVRGFVNNVFDEFEPIVETFEIETIPMTSFSPPRTYGVQLMYGF